MNQFLLSLIAVTLGFAANATTPAEVETPLYWMRLSAKNAQERTAIANTGVAIEVVNKDDVVVLGTESELNLLQKQNKIQTFYKLSALDFPAKDSNFHNYAELKAALELLAKTHPDIVTLGTIGKSVEKRDIFVLKIGANQKDPSTAAAFFVGGHHAREHLSVEMPLMLAQNLAQKYAAGDAEVRKLLSNRTVYIVPALNVDGVEYDVDSGRYRSWRKNRKQNADGTYGVDLNRNYDFHWGTVGASGNTTSETYYGTSAFSEPETQALRDFITSHPNISLVHSYHTFSELILYPWGHTDQPMSDANDFLIHKTMAEKMATWNGYTPQQSAELYLTSGDTCDWAYGVLHLVCFTSELDPKDMWDGGFYPGQDMIGVVFQKNWPAALYMIEFANSPARVLEPEHVKYGLSSPLIQ